LGGKKGKMPNKSRDWHDSARNDILSVGQALKVKWIEGSLPSAEVFERERAGTRKDRSDEKEMMG